MACWIVGSLGFQGFIRQEVANDDSLDDLFPDGLADTAHDLPKDEEEPEGAEGAEDEDEDEPPPFA